METQIFDNISQVLKESFSHLGLKHKFYVDNSNVAKKKKGSLETCIHAKNLFT